MPENVEDPLLQIFMLWTSYVFLVYPRKKYKRRHLCSYQGLFLSFLFWISRDKDVITNLKRRKRRTGKKRARIGCF